MPKLLKWLTSGTLALVLLSACGGGGGGSSGGGDSEAGGVSSSSSAQASRCQVIQAADTTTINVLALYTKAIADRYAGDPQVRISHLINTVGNDVLDNSGLTTDLSLVGIMSIDGHDDTADPNTALNDVTNGANEFSGVGNCRDALSADMVILYRDFAAFPFGGICGLGWVNGGGSLQSNLTNVAFHDRYMVSIAIPYTCQDFTTIHEMGHNWGLTHDRTTDPDPMNPDGAQPWARGHGVNGSFTTIMAYSTNFAAPNKSYNFSDPSLTCFSQPCGVAIGQPNQANAVNHLRIVMPQVIPYR